MLLLFILLLIFFLLFLFLFLFLLVTLGTPKSGGTPARGFCSCHCAKFWHKPVHCRVGSENMKRLLRLVAVAILPAIAMGCQSMGMDMPTILPIGENPIKDQNPVYIALLRTITGTFTRRSCRCWGITASRSRSRTATAAASMCCRACRPGWRFLPARQPGVVRSAAGDAANVSPSRDRVD